MEGKLYIGSAPIYLDLQTVFSIIDVSSRDDEVRCSVALCEGANRARVTKSAAAELIKRKFEANEIPVRARTTYVLYAWLRQAPECAPKDIKRITAESDERLLWFVWRFAKVLVARALHPVPMDLKGLEPVFSADELDARLAIIEGSESCHSAGAKELRGSLRQAVDGPVETNDDFDLNDTD